MTTYNVKDKTNNKIILKKELINKYKKTKDKIERDILVEIVKLLDIHYKKGASIFEDLNILCISGNNKYPKIIPITTYDNIKEMKLLIKEINNIGRNLYSNNINRYTLIKNIDTNIEIELGNLGISKTFSKNVPFEKLSTVYKLDKIIEQGIYFKTSFNINSKDGIKYHHFFTPIRIIAKGENSFIRIVIKEYTKDKTKNKKFYYHQIEYINDYYN